MSDRAGTAQHSAQHGAQHSRDVALHVQTSQLRTLWSQLNLSAMRRTPSHIALLTPLPPQISQPPANQRGLPLIYPALSASISKPTPHAVWILSAKGTYTMDVGADNKFPLYDILMANFRAGYDGNRAPFPIYIHSPWFGSADRQRDMKKFRGELRGIGWLAGGGVVMVRQPQSATCRLKQPRQHPWESV